jgi:hypothetical protein
MAHNLEIRFRCRALFEVLDMSLTDISKQESVSVSTLSEWKNDDREEYGGIWIKGAKKGQVDATKKKLQEELQATSVYDEVKNRISRYHGVNKDGGIEVEGVLDLASDNEKLQAAAEADITMLAAVQADWFDAQLFKNAMLSSVVLSNQVKQDVTKVRQNDIKSSSEIIKMAKEARFGKSPDTVIFNANGQYTPEELSEMSVEQLENLAKQEAAKMNAVDVEPEQSGHPSEHPKK